MFASDTSSKVSELESLDYELKQKVADLFLQVLKLKIMLSQLPAKQQS